MPSDRSVLERHIERVRLRPFTLEGFHRRRQRKDRNRRIGTAAVAVAVAAAGVGGMLRAFSSGGPTSPAAPSEPTASPTMQNIMELPGFSSLEPGTYFIDPDADPSTPLRVVYEVPVEGWSTWSGAVKFGEYADMGVSIPGEDSHVAVSITTVTNLVGHACRDHSPVDPPVGPSVNDLAAALAGLPPFRVTSHPKDVTIYGYSGKHLELTVPDLPVEGDADDPRFTECVGGELKSWISPNAGAFFGYTRPGYTEEFWILDVDGTRLVIAAERSPGAPAEDLAELQAILESIRIEP